MPFINGPRPNEATWQICRIVHSQLILTLHLWTGREVFSSGHRPPEVFSIVHRPQKHKEGNSVPNQKNFGQCVHGQPFEPGPQDWNPSLGGTTDHMVSSTIRWPASSNSIPSSYLPSGLHTSHTPNTPLPRKQR